MLLLPARQPGNCPHCGYSLVGAIETWRSACPLEGTCSECGEGFGWAIVLRPELGPPVWSFEHGRRISLRRWLLTSLAALRPRLLWRGLAGTTSSLGRLCLLAAAWLLILHAGAAIPMELWGAHFRYTPPRLTDYLPYWVWPWKGVIHVPTATPNTYRGADLLSTLLLTVGTSALAPALLLLVGRVRPRRRLPPREIARAALLSVPVTVMLAPLAVAGHVVGLWLEERAGILDVGSYALLLASILAPPVILCGWWRQALAHYFRVPNAGWKGVGLALAVIVSFIALLLLADLIGLRV
jgi:hypothetical protein